MELKIIKNKFGRFGYFIWRNEFKKLESSKFELSLRFTKKQTKQILFIQQMLFQKHLDNKN